MGRGTYRRRFSRKQRGGRELTADEWALHLREDSRHDFGKDHKDFYNRLVPADLEARVKAFPRDPPDEKDEPYYRRFFLNQVSEGEETRAQIIANPIQFKLFPTTQMFSHNIVPAIHRGSNVAVGHDAGSFITNKLGNKVRHFISLGNILDPAGSSRDRQHNPIWFQFNDVDPIQIVDLDLYGFQADWPGATRVFIDGSMNVTAQEVSRGVYRPDFATRVSIEFAKPGADGELELRDGPSTKVINPDEGPFGKGIKRITDYHPGIAGYFTSIDKVKKIGGDDSGNNIIRAKIGKTLGDLVQVAALQLNYNGTGQWMLFN